MIGTSKQAVLPDIGAMSEPFKDGYEQASKDEFTGWPTKYAPNERTIVQFLRDATGLLHAESYDEYTMRWISDLLAGWLRREQ